MDQILGKSSDDVLAQPRRGGRSLTTAERQSIDFSNNVDGWGSDLDRSVRPGVPMDKAPDIGIESLYPDFDHQIPRNKVHKSTEHAKLTPVFGNACPPRGLSGLIRDFAYGFSEGRLSHWTLLMLADRVDVVEEIFLDLSRLKVPNIPSEMGLGAELKYNRKAVVRNCAILGVGALALTTFFTMRRQSAQVRSLT